MNKGRFKSQALIDEQAILSCMVYVDLNPIRADICQTLEDSDYTSIKQRINGLSQTEQANHMTDTTSVKLSSFIGSSLKKDGIAFDLKDYLALADWTGRLVRDDKRGFIMPVRQVFYKNYNWMNKPGWKHFRVIC